MKRIVSLLLSAAMLLGLAACGGSSGAVSSGAASSQAAPAPSSQAVSPEAASSQAAQPLTAQTVRIAGLKGPTTMGLVNLLPMGRRAQPLWTMTCSSTAPPTRSSRC